MSTRRAAAAAAAAAVQVQLDIGGVGSNSPVDFDRISQDMEIDGMVPLDQIDPRTFKEMSHMALSAYLQHFGVQPPLTKPIMKRVLRALHTAMQEKDSAAVDQIRRTHNSPGFVPGEWRNATPDIHSRRSRVSMTRMSNNGNVNGSTGASAPPSPYVAGHHAGSGLMMGGGGGMSVLPRGSDMSSSVLDLSTLDPSILFGNYRLGKPTLETTGGEETSLKIIDDTDGESTPALVCARAGCQALRDSVGSCYFCALCCKKYELMCAMHTPEALKEDISSATVALPAAYQVVDRDGSELESLVSSAISSKSPDMRGLWIEPDLRPPTARLVPKGRTVGDAVSHDLGVHAPPRDIVVVPCPRCYEELSLASSRWLEHVSNCCPEEMQGLLIRIDEALEAEQPQALKKARLEVESRVARRRHVLSAVFDFNSSLLAQLASIFERPIITQEDLEAVQVTW